MPLKRYLLILVLLLTINTFIGCTTIEHVPKLIQKNITIVPHPIPVELIDLRFYVVTEDKYQDFKSTFVKKNGTFVYVAISVKDYGNLSLNIQEMKRFIQQQKDIIIYYENLLNKH